MGAGSDGVELQRRFLNRLHLESLFGGLSPFPSPFELAGARAGVFIRARMTGTHNLLKSRAQGEAGPLAGADSLSGDCPGSGLCASVAER